MSEDPAYSRAASLHLSRTLDEIGINTLTVGRRRKTFLYSEKVSITSNHLNGSEMSKFHFGSQTEGSTTPELDSDLDILICDHNYNVIEDWSAWQQGKLNLLMLQENTAPGYCRLQLLRQDVPMAAEVLVDEHFTYDDRGSLLMKNTLIHSVQVPGRPETRHGPAGSASRPGIVDYDIVYAFPCRSWPAQAEEFTRRHRRHGWPSQRLLHQAVKNGVFLVPTGHKLSPTEPLEWRISASLAERCLMFSLTIVHMKCYVVLKMLVKTFVEPRIKECISSYHCKTAVLYCTENSEFGFWCDENLLQCVQRCLAMLLTWVTDGFCPHFIMPRENLFAGKVNARNIDMLQSVFTRLVKSNGRALLRVTIDDLGNKLQARFGTEHSIAPVLDSLATVRLVGMFEYHVQSAMQERIRDILIEQKTKDLLSATRSVHQNIRFLRDRIREADKLERHAIQAYIEALFCWLGSLLASIALSRKARVPRAAIRLFRIGAKHDIASQLKLASVFYCSGYLRKVETILQHLETHFCRNEIQTVCMCYERPYKMSYGFCHMMSVLKGRRRHAALFACCVMFSPYEIHCAPPAIRHELSKAIGDDADCRHPEQDDWMDLAVVDCQPYMHFLQFTTFRQLGKRDLQRRALSNLERCIREDHDFYHLETSWNMLGQCKEMEQQPDAAMACYRTSLEIRPRNNAANWHVQNLRHTAIRNGE